jgi:phosphate acyltransferase
MKNQSTGFLCTIALDAMGGDYAPRNEVLAAVEAYKEDPSLKIILVGKQKDILNVLSQNNLSYPVENIVNADEVIRMDEVPTVAIRTKKNSSIVVGANLVKNKMADAFVSGGNTGAVMAAATLIIGRIEGVGRPAIGADFPTSAGSACSIYDVGASVDSKPNHLLEYAILGSIYSRDVNGVPNPKVGLLSVGEEDNKGSDLVIEARKLLKEANLNFIGNVEGRDILNGKADVVVCDGFVGNVVLKFGESFFSFLKIKLKNYAKEGIVKALKAFIVKGVLKVALKDVDYQTHGGVPLLGVNGITIIGHGSSSPLAIKNMIYKAKKMHEINLIQKFEEELNKYGKK